MLAQLLERLSLCFKQQNTLSVDIFDFTLPFRPLLHRLSQSPLLSVSATSDNFADQPTLAQWLCRPCEKSFSSSATLKSHELSSKHLATVKLKALSSSPPVQRQSKKSVEKASRFLADGTVADALRKLAKAKTLESKDPSLAATVYWNVAKALWSMYQLRDTAVALTHLLALLDRKSPLSFPPDKLHRQTKFALARLFRLYGIDVNGESVTSTIRHLYINALILNHNNDTRNKQLEQLIQSAVVRYSQIEEIALCQYTLLLQSELNEIIEAGQYTAEIARTEEQYIESVLLLVYARSVAFSDKTVNQWWTLTSDIASLLTIHTRYAAALIDLTTISLTPTDPLLSSNDNEVNDWIQLALLLEAFMLSVVDLNDRVRQTQLIRLIKEHWIQWKEIQFISLYASRFTMSPVDATTQLDTLQDDILERSRSTLLTATTTSDHVTNDLVVANLVHHSLWNVDIDVQRWRTWLRQITY